MTTVYVGREGRISWEFNRRTRILDLQGSGSIPSYSPFYGELPGWAALRDQFQEVRIGHGITRIGAYAFYPYDHGIYADMHAPLRRVIFPPTLESIGCSAFRANGSLPIIDLYGLPNLRSIEENAFASCFGAKAIDLGGCARLEELHPRAFWGCDDLTYIDLEDCHSLSRTTLRALRRETPPYIPIVMPDGRVWYDDAILDGQERECRVLLGGLRKMAFRRGQPL